jgi:hypothetical protein
MKEGATSTGAPLHASAANLASVGADVHIAVLRRPSLMHHATAVHTLIVMNAATTRIATKMNRSLLGFMTSSLCGKMSWANFLERKAEESCDAHHTLVESCDAHHKSTIAGLARHSWRRPYFGDRLRLCPHGHSTPYLPFRFLAPASRRGFSCA